MPRITRVYTRTGDDGTTVLGGGQRVSKGSPRIAAYGTVDELNALIGAAMAAGLEKDLVSELSRIQNELFHLGSDLCFLEEDKERTPLPGIEERHITGLEELMDRLSAEIPPLENFVLPGGSPGAAGLHVARTCCRRAERELVQLAGQERVGADTLRYLNRLSDALFVMARFENSRKGAQEPIWDSRG
jgi:cob(I)alamin adenosyltransferase